MLNPNSRPWLLGGVWLTAASVIVTGSVALGAAVSTSAFLLVMCAMPMAIVLVIGFGAPSPTVAELLYAVNNRTDGRS